eukprot:COSAG02_NODE_214_length_28689_cov_34.895523_13_plen_446_part_00
MLVNESYTSCFSTRKFTSYYYYRYYVLYTVPQRPPRRRGIEGTGTAAAQQRCERGSRHVVRCEGCPRLRLCMASSRKENADGDVAQQQGADAVAPWVALGFLGGASVLAMKCLGSSSNLEPIETALHHAKDELSSQIQTGLNEMVGTVNAIVQRALNPDAEAATIPKPKNHEKPSPAKPVANNTRSSKRARGREETESATPDRLNISTEQDLDQVDKVDDQAEDRVEDHAKLGTSVRGNKNHESESDLRRPTTTQAQTKTCMKKPASPVVATPKRDTLSHSRRSQKRMKMKHATVDLDEDRDVQRNDPPLILKARNNETIAEVADLMKVDQGDLQWLNQWCPTNKPLKPGTSLELPFVDVQRWKHEPRVNSRLIPDLGQATDEAKSELHAGDEEHEVERILQDDDRGGFRQYLVRWKGYGPESDTWEPASNLQGCAKVVEDYEKR